MIKAVIFDFDGTLANTIADLMFAANRALKKYGLPEHDEESYKIFVGNGWVDLLKKATGGRTDAETFEKIKKDFEEYYSVHYCDKTTAYEGVPELVDTCKKRGLLVAVVTNKNEDITNIMVDELYGDVFHIVCGNSSMFPAKPDPASTLSVMERLGVNPSECIFIGDSCVDMQTAVNSGAVAVGETWGFRGEKELLDNGAKYIIHKPQELFAVIDKENNL